MLSVLMKPAATFNRLLLNNKCGGSFQRDTEYSALLIDKKRKFVQNKFKLLDKVAKSTVFVSQYTSGITRILEPRYDSVIICSIQETPIERFGFF